PLHWSKPTIVMPRRECVGAGGVFGVVRLYTEKRDGWTIEVTTLPTAKGSSARISSSTEATSVKASLWCNRAAATGGSAFTRVASAKPSAPGGSGPERYSVQRSARRPPRRRPSLTARSRAERRRFLDRNEGGRSSTVSQRIKRRVL